jgi:hypothetical protein
MMINEENISNYSDTGNTWFFKIDINFFVDFNYLPGKQKQNSELLTPMASMKQNCVTEGTYLFSTLYFRYCLISSFLLILTIGLL